MKKKRIIGILTMTMMILATVFTGCGKSEDSVSGTQEPSEVKADKEAAGTSENKIDTATLQNIVEEEILSLDESQEYEVSMYIEEIKDENKMIGVGYSKKEGLYYMHVPMLGIPSVYLNYDTNQLYYYDEAQGGWFVSQNDGNVGSDDTDYVKKDLSSYYQGFSHILSAEYVGEKNLNGTDYYVLAVETASDTPEIIYEDGCAIVPTPDGGSIYVYEGGSSTYGDVEYTFADDGTILANGKPYVIDESFVETYVSQVYISKDTLRLYAIGAEDEALGSYYLVISTDELHIPDELISAEEGDFQDYLFGFFEDPEVEMEDEDILEWNDDDNVWDSFSETTTEPDIDEKTDTNVRYGDFIYTELSNELEIGQSCSIIVSVIPEGYTLNDLVYTSEDPSVACVSDNGYVTAISEGIAKITTQTSDGKYTDTCYIVIKNGDM